jgi:hypothetical protein
MAKSTKRVVAPPKSRRQVLEELDMSHSESEDEKLGKELGKFRKGAAQDTDDEEGMDDEEVMGLGGDEDEDASDEDEEDLDEDESEAEDAATDRRFARRKRTVNAMPFTYASGRSVPLTLSLQRAHTTACSLRRVFTSETAHAAGVACL